VSHQVSVEGLRGQTYDKPLSTMRAYLDAMDSGAVPGRAALGDTTRVLAALGPKMLELARDRAGGAHPYFVPVEHTPVAREALGPDRLLAPEQAVVLETDPTTAREIARSHLKIYLGLPNYTNNLRRFGFGDDDLSGGGSDRLVDAIVAWGDVDTWLPGCGRTSTPAPTTSASRSSTPTPASSRSVSGRSWPAPSASTAERRRTLLASRDRRLIGEAPPSVPWTAWAGRREAVPVFLGEDLLPLLVLAFGAAMAIGSAMALVRPPARREEGDLAEASVGRSVVFIVIGVVAAVWSLASLLSG
jgi:hypothetical protein